MVKEEAMTIKESLQDSSLDQFRAWDGWLDTWKSAYAIKERRIVGEAGNVAEETITSWMERIQELTEGYSSEKEAKGDKKSKQRFTIAFFVNAAGEKIDDPVVIWKSKKPCCFKRLSDKSRTADVHYFSNPISWMTSNVMQAILTRFNRKLLSVSSEINSRFIFANKDYFST